MTARRSQFLGNCYFLDGVETLLRFSILWIKSRQARSHSVVNSIGNTPLSDLASNSVVLFGCHLWIIGIVQVYMAGAKLHKITDIPYVCR